MPCGDAERRHQDAPKHPAADDNGPTDDLDCFGGDLTTTIVLECSGFFQEVSRSVFGLADMTTGRDVSSLTLGRLLRSSPAI